MEKKQKQLALNFMVPGVKIANFGASRFTQDLFLHCQVMNFWGLKLNQKSIVYNVD